MNRPLSIGLRAICFAVAYFLCAVLGNYLALRPGSFVNFWPPSGLFVATLLLHQPRHWPWFVLAAFPANLGFDLCNHQALHISFLFCCGNCLEAVVGAWLVRRFVAPCPTLSSVREVTGLTLFSALLSTTLSATVGASVVTHLLGGPSFAHTWLLWWSGDVVGILLVAPLILVWRTKLPWFRQGHLSARQSEAMILVIVLVLCSIYIFRDDWHRSLALKYLVIPFVMWAAFRFGQAGATAINLVIAMVAAWFTVHGYSDVATVYLSPRDQVTALQLYLSVVALIGLYLAAVLAERQRTEAALRDNESAQRAILEAASESVFLMELTGKVLTLNSTTARRLGKRPEEIQGRSIYDFLPAALVTSRKARIETVIQTGQPLRFEDTRAGMCFEHTVCPVLNSEGQVTAVASFGRDITERKRLEAERQLFLDLLVRINAAKDRHDLMRSVTQMLRAATNCDAIGIRLREGDDFPYFETHGFPEEFVLVENHLCARNERGELVRDSQGNPVLECMCGNILCERFDPAKPFFTARGSFWSNGTTQLLASTTEADRQTRTRNRCNGEGYESVALIALRTGGETFGLLQCNDHRPGRFTPEMIGMLERFADYLALALARWQATEALRQSETRLRTIIETTEAGYFRIDRAGRYRQVNPAWLRLHRYASDDEILDRHFSATQVDMDLEQAQAIVEQLLDRGTTQTGEFSRRCKDGSIGHHTFSINPVREGDKVIGMEGFLIDITERKQAEEKIERALAEKELLLKEVHHRVKNNLQVVSGLLQLQSERLADPRVREAIKESQSRIKSMALAHEKLYQSSDLARLDFRAYVQSLVAHLFRAHLAKGRVVRFDLHMAETSLDLDTAIPCGLLINELVTNALKHAFREDRPAQENTLSLQLEQTGDLWRFSVADNGAGMAAGVDWTQPATLGLRLVQMLVKQLGGTVRLEPGPGCRFVFEFRKT